MAVRQHFTRVGQLLLHARQRGQAFPEHHQLLINELPRFLRLRFLVRTITDMRAVGLTLEQVAEVLNIHMRGPEIVIKGAAFHAAKVANTSDRFKSRAFAPFA